MNILHETSNEYDFMDTHPINGVEILLLCLLGRKMNVQTQG